VVASAQSAQLPIHLAHLPPWRPYPSKQVLWAPAVSQFCKPSAAVQALHLLVDPSCPKPSAQRVQESEAEHFKQLSPQALQTLPSSYSLDLHVTLAAQV